MRRSSAGCAAKRKARRRSFPSAPARCCWEAAGLIRGKRATTHWASFHLLPWFGAIPVDERVVVDGDWIFAAGATSGIDGALSLAAEVRGVPAAQLIQLDIAYAPEPPFQSGTPRTAPPEIVEAGASKCRPN